MTEQLPRIPRDGYPFKIPAQTIVLDHWQTPAFCRAALKAKTVGSAQKKRYEAIARNRDWNVKRNWPLRWLEVPTDENGERDPVEREARGSIDDDVDKWHQLD